MPNSSNPAHQPEAPRSGLVWGIARGHVNTRRAPAPKASRRKGAQSQRNTVVNSVVREVVGFAPYERRAMELIRNSKDKRARKFIKRRLGTLRRAKGKMEFLTNVIAEQRRAGHA
ncbi:ribosomal protein L36e [Tilletiopsis washingtonensis]|uniref:60S ribosomal protein L36 n=1 Tax=Tilletiopsis washingtonensis TaxID=58919 RepID=A0A316Z505_9BASI|nr:ribosomal protein L36e [Tilletiopsis washingtonensis]PWN96174.1 ribosomal protein L36e [Tilletiopsis washingtonensis]